MIAPATRESVLDQAGSEREANVGLNGERTDGDEPYRLYWASELDELPPQQWLVEGAIPRGGLVALIGQKGVYKTFVGIDLACHMATGIPYHDRAVTPGIVVYVYAEGSFGAKMRIDAWCDFKAREIGRHLSRADLKLVLLPMRIPINEPSEVNAFVAAIRAKIGDVQPSAIFIDTLNRNLTGPENDDGMNGFVAGCASLQRAFGATVLVTHHTPLGDEDRGRGHGAFDGAVDTRLIIKREDVRVRIECTHQRNGPDGWKLAYTALKTLDSLALKPSSPIGDRLWGKNHALLKLVYDRSPATYTDLLNAWIATKEKVPTFKKCLNKLRSGCYVAKKGDLYSVTEKATAGLGLPGIGQGYDP